MVRRLARCPDEYGFRHGLLSADRVIAVCLDRGVLRGVRRAGWKRSHLGSVPPPEGSRDRVRFPSTPGTFTRSEWPITGQVLDPLEGSSGWGYRQSCHQAGRLARSTGLRFPPDAVTWSASVVHSWRQEPIFGETARGMGRPRDLTGSSATVAEAGI